MDQIPSSPNKQSENKNPVNIPPVPLNSPVLPTSSGSTVSSTSSSAPVVPKAPQAGAKSFSNNADNIPKVPLNENTAKGGQAFKLASAEVQGPKPPLVAVSGSKFTMVAIAFVAIAVLGIGGYYFYGMDSNIDQPANSPVASTPVSMPAVDNNTDTDKDGLPDKIEKVLGTYMTKADTDGDGYNDLNEIKSGYSPLIAGAVGKYSSEEWDLVKGKIKTEDRGFYERVFEGQLSAPSSTGEKINLKNYKNQDYKFELEYPNDWEIVEKTGGIISFAKTADIKTKNPDEFFIIQIRIANRKPEVSFIEQIKGKTGNDPELSAVNGKNFYYAKNQIAGITFYEYSLEHADKIFQIVGIIFSKLPDNAVDESDIVYFSDDELKEELVALNKIVSSFNYIE